MCVIIPFGPRVVNAKNIGFARRARSRAFPKKPRKEPISARGALSADFPFDNGAFVS